MQKPKTMLRLRDGTIVDAAAFKVIPDGAILVHNTVLMDTALPAGVLLADTAGAEKALADARRNVLDAWGASTEWLASLDHVDAGSAKRVIAEATSGDAVRISEAASAADSLASRFELVAQQPRRTGDEQRALKRGAEHLRGMATGARAVVDGAARAAGPGTPEEAHAAMNDHLTNAWRN